MNEPLQITWDLSSFERGLRRAMLAYPQAAEAQMRLNGLDLRRESQELAPLHEGTLAASARDETVSNPKEIVTTVSYHTPYATRVHYEMAPAPGSRMQPGPGTRGKPGTEFGPAGGLYLTRPLIGKAKRYYAAVAAKLRGLK